VPDLREAVVKAEVSGVAGRRGQGAPGLWFRAGRGRMRQRDLSSASALCAPTAEEVARFSQRSAHTGRDVRPGQTLDRPPRRLPSPRLLDPPLEPEPELGEVSSAERQRIREAVQTPQGDEIRRSTSAPVVAS